MQAESIRYLLQTAGEEITDEHGTVIGYVAQPARFKVDVPHLAQGGFLIVHRDEATGHYIGTEFDALPHPKTGAAYPAGHSEQRWQAENLEQAFRLVLAYFPETGVESTL